MRIKGWLYLVSAALAGWQYTAAVGVAAPATPAPTDSRMSSAGPAPDGARPAGMQGPDALSPQAEQVARIATENGDSTFLMIDKARGEIVVFAAGKATYSAPALTGVAMGDRVPSEVLKFSGIHPLTVEQKVTPAGRFTVRPEFDPEFGRVWTLNEIHGKDWDFAIHQVYLGSPSEHRDARLRSPDPADRHITWGCINVERRTVQYLSRVLPKLRRIPLYILPQDASLTEQLFPLRKQSAAAAASIR